MANIFWMKRDTDNRKRALESTRGFLHRLKILWTLVHKRLKIGSEISPILRKFCIVLLTRTQPNVAKREEINGADASRIRWRRIVNVNVTIEIRSLVCEVPKRSELAMASRRAAFSGNTSLIATFSSFTYSCSVQQSVWYCSSSSSSSPSYSFIEWVVKTQFIQWLR